MPVYYNKTVDGPVTYFQSSVSGKVIGVVGEFQPQFFWHKSDNSQKELFNLNMGLAVQKYVEIDPPKTGDVIYLHRNNINLDSPHAKKYFKVLRTEGFWVSIESVDGDYQLGIDIRNWVWHNTDLKKVSPEKPTIVIKDGDIINQDGRQFKVTLTEIIPEQKFRIGDIINDQTIVDAEFKDGEWYYMVYYRNIKELVELREIFINF